jgi:chromatin remodeling complex protein RSC6
VKGKHLLTLDELIGAKRRWIIPSTAGRREKEESSDESYDANNDKDASFDISSRKRRKINSSRKRGRKRQKDVCVAAVKPDISIQGHESIPNRVLTEGVAFQGDTKWASPELLEFIGHMRNGDSSCISQYAVQVLLLEYIKQNNLRDPHRKSQIICDARLSNLFRKPRVAHFEMLKLLEMHFHVKENPTVNADTHPDSAQLGSDKRRKVHKKIERELTANPEDYAAIDMHNINLIYLRRSLMEDLIDDNAAFSEKIAGAFVRIRICGLGQKQDMYRLVKVLGNVTTTREYIPELLNSYVTRVWFFMQEHIKLQSDTVLVRRLQIMHWR